MILIFGWNNYPAFREDFIDLELAETEVEELNNSFSDRLKIEGRAAYDSALLSGKIWAPGGLPIYTRDEKERLKLEKRIQTESKKSEAYQKFNPELIRKITGLTEEDEIIRFMVLEVSFWEILFCGFVSLVLSPDEQRINMNRKRGNKILECVIICCR